ncbi:TRAP transporter permease [Alkalicoccus chagannorensis]|uniref:TRAP transporter permease n=1 Tax=Alkalicoccus chagannorensis TaxID=427072 RepID=UPI000429DD99|nr:TRAP transporter fused permease subunit [Alkalicoccus chagannorensis]
MSDKVENKTDIPPENVEVEKKRYRLFETPVLRIIQTATLILIPLSGIMYVLNIHQRLGFTLFSEQYFGLFFALILFGVFLTIPASKKAATHIVPWYDWILALAGLTAGGYVFIYYPDIMLMIGQVTTERFLISMLAVLLVLEAIRRMLGLVLLGIVVTFISYGFLAPFMPGVLRGSGTAPDQLFNYLYLDPSAMMSMLNLAATIGLVFILFGQILIFMRGGDILNDIALFAFGRYRGGPAKGSVLGSTFIGSVTGNPVSNVLLTGNVTIPLMKRNGFSSNQAGAIESVASTGGQLIPPVMGIAAFIIAETLGVPYMEVAIAAIIPALLYYMCLFMQVDFIAARQGAHGLKPHMLPPFKGIMKVSWLVLPAFGSLIYFLFIVGYTPSLSGMYASVIALLTLGLLQKHVRRKFFTRVYEILTGTGKLMLEITVVLAAAGIVMGVTGITGLGFNIGMVLQGVADYGLLTLLIISALVCIVLGMGMPSVAAYAVVAVLVAPTLIELGVTPIAAHLFVFYFAIVSNFTPPIAVACFAAAPIAKASPHKIGFKAMQLGLVAYIVPFLFVYAPELLISVDGTQNWGATGLSLATAVFACYLLAAAIEKYLFHHLTTTKRMVLILCAAGLFFPVTMWEFSWIVNLTAAIGAIILMVAEWKSNNWKKKEREEGPTTFETQRQGG